MAPAGGTGIIWLIYNADDTAADLLLMFGFIRVENGTVEIANRIFETRLYNFMNAGKSSS